MPNLMNIISPRKCGIVKERNKSRHLGKSSSSQTSFSLANTLFSFTQTFENIEVGKDDNRDDSSVNVDSDVDLFSTMNAGRDMSPRRKLSRQNSYDNAKMLKFDGCGGISKTVDNNGRRMKSPKKCFRACGGSRTDESSISDHPRRSLSNRSMAIEGARSPSISLGVVDGSFSFSAENDIEESHSFEGSVERKKPFSPAFADEGSFNFSAENDIEETHSFDGSVERKKRFSSAFILSRNDSIDSGAVSSSASFQSKGTNVTLSDLYSKETNTLDTGSLSASTSFQSKDTNLTASDLYSKETCTENYDSSDSQSESKSTLTSKEKTMMNPNAKFHFDRFFSKESYTDTYDSSDSQSESMTASSEEDDDDYSLDRSKSSSYSDKTESSDTCTEHDDNSLDSESEISNHSRVLVKSAKYSNRYLIESRNQESLGGSETSSSSGSTTSFDVTLKDRYTHEEDMVLACRSPRDFNAAIDDKTSQVGNKTSSSRGIPTSSGDTVNDRYVQQEDTVLAYRSPRAFNAVVDDETETIQEDDSRLVVHLPNSLYNDVSQQKRSTFTTSKISLAKADCKGVSLADDTTEISISNMASLCSDVIRYDSNIENVRTDELYEPENGSLNHTTYNNGLHSDVSLKENFTRFLFDDAAIPPDTALHGDHSRADNSIAISPDAAAYRSDSRVDNFIGSCENAVPPKQDFLPNNIKELHDVPPPPPPYDATFLAMQHELHLTVPQGKSNAGEESLSQLSLVTPSHTACHPNSNVNVINNHTSEASADLFKQERGQLHDVEDTEQPFNDAVASLSLPGMDSTSNHTNTGMNLNNKSQDNEPLLLPSTVAFSSNELKRGMSSEKDFDSASLLSHSDNTTPSDRLKTGCHPNNTVSITDNHTSETSDALFKQERCRLHDVIDTERVIDAAASSLPLPIITSTSNQLKIAMNINDKAPDYEPLLLPSTVSFSSNNLKNGMNLNQEDLDSASLLPPPDNFSPTNHLETGTFLIDDDSSFFTALVEPNLSIDTDNNDATAAAFENALQVKVENSSVMSCHCGEGKSPCTISHDDQTATKATTSDNEGNFSFEHSNGNSLKDQTNSDDKNEVSAYCDQTDDFIKRLRANVAAATNSINYNGVNYSEARCDDSVFHALIDQIDSNDYNLVNTILNDPDINQILSIKFDFWPDEDTDEALTSDSDAKEILKDVRPLQTNQGIAGEHFKQVCIAVEEIMQQCRRLELLEKGISQEAAHVSINSAVEKIVQACRQFDALDEKLCRDTTSDDRESQKVTEKSCSELDGGAVRFSSTAQAQKEMLSEKVLFTDVGRSPEALEKPAPVSSGAFRDAVPVSPSKISQRFNQRIGASRLHSQKSTNMSGHDQSNEKGGPSNFSHAKETLVPDVTLHLDVRASPKVDEIPALASPYKLIRQLALRKKVFENQKVAFFDAFRDTPASPPCLTSPQRRTSAAIITGRKLSRQRNNRATEKNKHARTELNTETVESTISLEKQKDKEPIVKMGTFFEVNEKEQPVIISYEKSEPKFAAEKERKGTKNGRRLSRKRSERNSRSVERKIYSNTDLNKETIGTLNMSEDKVSPAVELKTPLECCENPIIKLGTSLEVNENEQSLIISSEKSEPKCTAEKERKPIIKLETSLEVGEKEQSVNISPEDSEQKFAAEKERKGTKTGRKPSNKCGEKNSRLIERKIVENTDMFKETIEPLNKSEEKVSDKVSALVELKSSVEVCEDPIIKLGTSLEVGRKELPVIISSEKNDPKRTSTGDKERKETKTGRKLSHKRGERNSRSIERKIVANSDMNKETMEPLNKSEDNVSEKVLQSVELESSLEVCERQQPASSETAETLNETEKETGRLLVSSCSLEERDEKMSDEAIAIELRTHSHYDVAIAPPASAFSDPSAYSSPSKQNRRLERAAKMLDLRKNKHRDKRNDGGDVALSLRNESSDAIKDAPLGTSSPSTLNQLYEHGANMHRDILEKHSYREEVMMINSSGSSNSFNHGSLSIDTAVQVCSFEETVCTTKHSNVFPNYLRYNADALPDPSAKDTATIKVAGDVSAVEHHLLSPPRSGLSTPRSLRKIASPAAARDRMKTARRLWHTDISPKAMHLE